MMKVTAGVKCYNNVRHVRAALESAFAQSYRPLEIVVSDDGSTDGSWDVVREVVAAHKGEKGVEVVLNRNESNLGNLGNWEKICELASGEFVVKFDGDDISLGDRVEKIVRAVEESRKAGGNPAVVGHGGWLISSSGKPMGEMYRAVPGNIVGAAMAFSKRCLTDFGKATCDPKIVDDELYALRGMMLGDFLEMPDKLVLYRMGTGVSNAHLEVRRPMSRIAREKLVALSQNERDVACLRGGACVEVWRRRLADEREQAEARRDLIDGPSMRIRRAGARRLRRDGRVWRFLKFAFVLPRFLGTPLLFAYAVARYASRRIAALRGCNRPA